MNRVRKIMLVVLGMFMLMSNKLTAQVGTSSEIMVFDNLKIGFFSGAGTLMKEFGELSQDFDHKVGNTYGIEFSKLVTDEVEVGFAGNQTYLTGIGNNPEPSWFTWWSETSIANGGEGKLRPKLSETPTSPKYPMMYSSQTLAFKIFVQYNFQRFYTAKRGYLPFNLYLKFGFGMSYVQSELRYVDIQNRIDFPDYDPVYEIGRGDNEILRNSSLVTGDIGFEYHLSDRFSFRVQSGVTMINKDFIDGVFNRINKKESQGTFALLGNAMGGIVYHFNYTTDSQKYNEAYPWFEKKFKNLYSKFYRPKSQKVQLLNYPWHSRQSKKK